MNAKTTGLIEKRTLAVILALALSVLLAPTVAFADGDAAGGDTNQKVTADARTQDFSGEYGNVTPSNGSICIDADAAEDHTATVTAKNLTTDANSAITADATSRGIIDIKTGNVTSDCDNGVQARVDGEGTIKVSTGDIASGDQGSGIWTSADNREVLIPQSTITVAAGNINAQGEGIVIRPYMNSAITVKAGNVQAKGDGVQIVSEEGAYATLTANDITSDRSGMWVYIGEGSSINALITGTLSGAKAPLSFFGSDFMNTGNFNLAVWKIALNDGSIVFSAQPNEAEAMAMKAQAETRAAAENEPRMDMDGWIFSPWFRNDEGSAFEKTINYIVKVENPTAGGTISVTKADGSALDPIEGYEFGTARQDDKILLKVNLEDGYRIVGAYNGDELLEGENGEYYLVIPKGGGVSLSVKLEKDGDESLVNIVVPEDDSTTKATSANTGTGAGAGTGTTLPATGDDLPVIPVMVTLLASAFALAVSRTKLSSR